MGQKFFETCILLQFLLKEIKLTEIEQARMQDQIPPCHTNVMSL